MRATRSAHLPADNHAKDDPEKNPYSNAALLLAGGPGLAALAPPTTGWFFAFFAKGGRDADGIRGFSRWNKD